MKFSRRALASLVAGLPLFGKAPAIEPHPPKRRRYPVPPTLWFESKDGRKFVPEIGQLLDPSQIPAEFVYQHFADPTNLRETVYSRDRDFSGELIAINSSWSEDLALALANDGYRLSEAIMIVANLCERCTNSAAHEYGLNWGYPLYSEQWLKAHTVCDLCRDEPVARGTGFYKITAVDSQGPGEPQCVNSTADDSLPL